MELKVLFKAWLAKIVITFKMHYLINIFIFIANITIKCFSIYIDIFNLFFLSLFLCSIYFFIFISFYLFIYLYTNSFFIHYFYCVYFFIFFTFFPGESVNVCKLYRTYDHFFFTFHSCFHYLFILFVVILSSLNKFESYDLSIYQH